ncbi:MAG: collagen-like protein [Bacteroidales bacterium]|nr:collagen-like protein [Bacteroidales bacterium]
MKKLLLVLLTALSAATFQSCGKGDPGPVGPMGPAGRDGEDGVVFYHTADFTVDAQDWELRAPNNKPNERYFRYEFDYKELTEEMCNIGVTNVYHIYNDGYQNPLPSTKYHSYNQDGQTMYYSQTVDYEYAPGKIIFIATNSDFFTDEKPETMTFRVITHY